MEIQFQKYPKMSMRGTKTDDTWIVLEKIHGSNFSFILNGQSYQCARRTGLIFKGEQFFNWEVVDEKYAGKMLNLYDDAVASLGIENIQLITVFGELFGGIYPHDDVKDLGYQPAQRGVYYTADVEFAAFDIMLVCQGPEDEKPTKIWLEWDMAMELLERHEIFHLKPLMRGQLSECRAFDIKINSTLPEIFGLAPLEKNMIEGVVVKSEKRHISTEDTRNPRMIFKYKNKKFAEVNPKAPLTQYEIERETKRDAESRFYDDIDRYVTRNRLNNLISKIGTYDNEKYDEVAHLLSQDVFEDYAIDNPETMENLQHCLDKLETNVLKMCLTLIQSDEDKDQNEH